MSRTRVVALALDALGDGVVHTIALPRGADGRPREALVMRDSRGAPRAYLNLCKHIPVPLDGGSRRFLDSSGRFLICGTHGALYEPIDGHCFLGPCKGKSLTPIDMEIDGSTLVLVID